MSLIDVVQDFGLNLNASAVWDTVKYVVQNRKPSSKEELIKELTQKYQDVIEIEKAELFSKEVINLLVSQGAIFQDGNHIYSNDSIVQKTGDGGIIVTKNSTTETPNTRITVQGAGATITQKGNAEIRQGADGISITVRGGNK